MDAVRSILGGLSMSQMMMMMAARLKNQKGIGTIEMVLLIFILVGVVVLFKEKVVELITDILNTLSNDINDLKSR